VKFENIKQSPENTGGSMISDAKSALHSSVLTLNRGFLAIHTIPVRRAFCLLFKGMAEVINIEDGRFLAYDFDGWCEISEMRLLLDEIREEGDWISAVNFRVQVPRVIRLLGYDRVPCSTVKFSRRNVFLRDEHRCQYCQKHFGTSNLSLDHVVPRSRGGRTSWSNIVCACLKCNVRKGGRTPREAGMRLLQKPIRPKRSPMLSHHLDSDKYAEWRTFLR
jgi:5-methylcytosine-specific restriction endonuclease McrA